MCEYGPALKTMADGVFVFLAFVGFGMMVWLFSKA